MIGTTLSHYRITAAIGAGGMGEVYRATDTRLGREVALKLLPKALAADPERVARFDREARLLASLNHPNIAHLYGFETSTLDDGSLVHVIAMELVAGEDLAERLTRGPVPVDEAILFAKQIAEALEEAHEKGIVHRDLKPGNVKLTPDGRVKVLDFGLAKAWTGEVGGATSSPDLSHSPTMTRGTEAGMILGTAAYMSPEQARGKAVDKRTDIWAFGVVLWEMLTGKRLFVGETVSDVLAAVLTRETDWAALAPLAPGRLRELLRRCLDRNPKQRLHDIADARIVLEELVSGAGGEAPASGPTRGAGSPRRQTFLLAALAMLTLIVAGLGWALVRGRAPVGVTPRSLSVVLPENLRLVDDSAGSIAISPDGTRLVVAAQDEGAERLYLRELGSPELRPLAGTDGASGPFFSPDGRWIAFSANGLRKLSLEGGAPVKIAPGIFGAGAWSAAGEIYFTPDYNAGLHRVAAAGGTPQELTRPEPGQELNHSFPELLPGGRALVFTSHRVTLAESRIEALSFASGERHVVVEHAIEARYLHSGHLAFVRDETLMVAPFDLETLRLAGPALPARQEVAVLYGMGHAEYSLSGNGTLALVPRTVMPARREVVRLDRAGRAETILAAEKTVSGPALSPDGQKLALTRNEGGLELLLYDLEKHTSTRLAASARREFHAVWDRSGTRVFYVIDLPIFQIFEVATSGSGEPKRFLEGTQDQIPQDVSPDGKSLLYSERMRKLGILPLARPQEARLFRGTEGGWENFGSFSPDGQFVALQSNESGRKEVYVRPVAEGLRDVSVSRAGGQQPRWAKNGELFFWQGDALLTVSVRTSPRLQIGEPRILFRTARGASPAVFEGDYDVSADGQSIYLARTPDLLRPREIRVVVDWGAEVSALLAGGGGN